MQQTVLARVVATLVGVLAATGAGAAEGGGVVTVAQDGSGEFRSVQAAVDAVPAGNAERVVIRIRPGTYKERVVIPKDKPYITLRGEDPKTTVLTYDWNAHSLGPDGKPVGTTGSASTTVKADDFVAENVTFENSAGDTGQAVAIKAEGDRHKYKNCRFLGWQDTLYAHGGRQYYVDCEIEGRVDFIFGSATAVFERCLIRSKNGGYVTAANTPAEQAHGYVFRDCRLVSDDGVATWLGRPWQWDRGRKASVVFVNTAMGPHIRAEGWNPWHRGENRNERPGETTRYGEYGTTDLEGRPVDLSGRVEWARRLTAEEVKDLTVEGVLSGGDGWDPRQ